MTTAGGSGYDTLNRLVAAQASSGPYQGMQAAWSYDSFGNRTSESFGLAQGAQVTAPIPPSTAVTPAISNQIQSIRVGTANYTPSYDASGDVTVDPSSGNHYAYDGEGRICAVSGPSGTMGYLYDAEGNRVAKSSIQLVMVNGTPTLSCDMTQNGFMTSNNETDYILGPGGEQVSEVAQDSNGGMNWQRTYVYAAGALFAAYDPSPDNPTKPLPSFRLTDWLGTLRATTDSAGVLQGTCTGLPFGDGLACAGNIPDPHHFTGKERDAESGNDYFSARYYSSSMGRFLSPDWSAKVAPVPYAKLDDPQSLNLYAYVRNNPLVRFDPDGHWVCKGDSEKCKGTQTRLNLAQAAQKQLAASDNAADRKEAGRIQKVLDFYGPLSTKAGDKGDNGVNVSFGALKKNELGKAELGADGHTVNIKLDWGQLSSIGRGSSLGSGGMSLGLGAGLLIHEGTHGVDERNWGHLPLTPGQEDWTEHNAYRNESYTYQGLNFGETNLWHSGMTESERNSAIDANSKLSDAASEER